MPTEDLVEMFVGEGREHVRAMADCLLQLERDPANPEPLHALFRAAHTLKGMSAAMGFEALETLTHRLEDTLAAARERGRLKGRKEVDVLLQCVDALEAGVENVAVGKPPAAATDFQALLARLPAIPEEDAEDDEPLALPAPAPPPPEPAPAPGSAVPTPPTPDTGSVRVGFHRLDALLDNVGELVVTKNRLVQVAARYADPEITGAIHSADRLLTELKSVTLSMRLLPLGHVFERYPRMVRDLLRNMGKDAEFVVQGHEIEVDRTVADRLGEALVHLLRNAISHGLETPAERERAGKPARATIALRAWRDGENVVVMVTEDGRGIDPAAVAEKAVARGVLAPEAAGRVGLGNVLDVLTIPGFSTTDHADAVSGRGVGMDVVKQIVESVQGRMLLATVPGEGTSVSLHIPLKVTIFPAMLVRVAGETLAVPLHAVESALSVTMDELQAEDDVLAQTLDGVVRLIYLRAIFGWDPEDVPEDQLLGLVVQSQGDRFAVIVDEILGQEEIVAKPLDRRIYPSRLASGAAVTADGTVALILDVDNVAKERYRREIPA